MWIGICVNGTFCDLSLSLYSLQVMMIRSSCRRLYWTTWKRMLRQMPHWWWVYIRLTSVQGVTSNIV